MIVQGRGPGLVARALVVWLRHAASTTSASIAPTSVDMGIPDLSALTHRILADADRDHVIVPFWSAHQLTIALLTNERLGLAALRHRFEVVVDDSFGGEMMRRVGESFGLTMRSLHSKGNPERFNDVADWLRRPSSFLIAVDGASPYGTVPTGIIRLASRMKSIVWPIAVRSRRSFRLPALVAEVPLPYSPIAVGVAPAFTVDRSIAVGAVAEDLRRRLNAATAAASAAVGAQTERFATN